MRLHLRTGRGPGGGRRRVDGRGGRGTARGDGGGRRHVDGRGGDRGRPSARRPTTRSEYWIIGAFDGFDFNKPYREQENLYDLWEANEAFFELVEEFYKNVGGVKIYHKEDDVDREDEE